MSFYLQYKGLIMNFIAMLLFWLFNSYLKLRDFRYFSEYQWLGGLVLCLLLLEPWATRYSIGVFNQRRKTLGIKPIWLHQTLGNFISGAFLFCGRFGLNCMLVLMSLFSFIPADQVGATLQTHSFWVFGVLSILLVRELLIILALASQKP